MTVTQKELFMDPLKKAERTILVSLWDNHHRPDDTQVRELTGLVEAAGGQVVGTLSQRRDNIHQGLGKGALADLGDKVSELDASTVVSDIDLSPSMLSQWSRSLPGRVRVLDRTQVILDIFAQRATSREGTLQVELAQLRYLLPRVGAYRISERSGGGIGTRGPGETPLEMDRRRLRYRIQRLSQELDSVAAERKQRRQRRAAHELPLIALVGYTNVGKSTLFSRLTGSSPMIADALFVTLDPTVRRIEVPGFGPALLSDTVGFVDRLPHALVNAFHATLDEVRDADVLVVVTNGSDPERDHQLTATQSVLQEVDADEIPQIVVSNQADRVPPLDQHPATLWISATTGQGLQTLWDVLRRQLLEYRQAITLFVPWAQKETWQAIYQSATIIQRQDEQEGSWLAITCANQQRYQFIAFESHDRTPPW